METDLKMHVDPGVPPPPSWRGRAAVLIFGVIVVLAVMWGETWAIEHSADLVAYSPPVQAESTAGTPGEDRAAGTIPVATLH